MTDRCWKRTCSSEPTVPLGVRELAFGPKEEFFHYFGFRIGAYSFRDPELAAAIGGQVRRHRHPQGGLFFYRLLDGSTTALAVHRSENAARRTILRPYCAPGTATWRGFSLLGLNTAPERSTTT